MHCRSMVHISIFLRVWSGPVNTFLMLRFYRSSQMCAVSNVQKTGFEGIFLTFLLESYPGRKIKKRISYAEWF